MSNIFKGAPTIHHTFAIKFERPDGEVTFNIIPKDLHSDVKEVEQLNSIHIHTKFTVDNLSEEQADLFDKLMEALYD